MEALTIVIAVVALWVAYQQWKTNSLRYKHELYERRLNVYKVLVVSLRTDHTVTQETVVNIKEALLESHFLFNDDVQEFIEKVWVKINDMARLNEIMNEGHSDLTMKKNWVKLADDIIKLEKETKPIFSKYLRLTK